MPDWDEMSTGTTIVIDIDSRCPVALETLLIALILVSRSIDMLNVA